MERKTMGSFLAALRKANGLTQRELAEKLNVSDKSVSRWERDEGAPELSLIPVIAEIFGVTSDELLRGERCAETGPSHADSPRTEKQRARLLAASLSRFQNKSCLAIGLALCGLLAAMIANLAFLRAYIGFFAGALFFLAAVIVQIVCVNAAFLAVSDDDLPVVAVGGFRCAVIFLAEKSIGLSLTLFAATLPLIVFTADAYRGLSGEWFLQYGLLFGIATAVFFAVATACLNAHLLKTGRLALGEKAEAAYRHNHQLQKKCVLILSALLLTTAFANGAATGFGDVGRLAKGLSFDNFDTFKTFMEQDIPAAPKTDCSATYHDADGNVISPDAARTHTLEGPDGTVLCTFVHRNETVTSWRYGYSNGNMLPITVFTEAQFTAAWQQVALLNTVFLLVYLLEIAATLLFYCRKRLPQKA